ncbi:hypothetical protein [Oceanicola sp. 502str15]|uniref:hypothetical protein n=1 Tax=Oceanicola sp. 502str15 TaxID=2696061 RepID=UPI00209578DC|nr:hypothetical protein [Oceanicola sp. 502str15]MCO6382256.1 hypothetical protein [Oceanicola sp. 502str15]
MLRGMGAACGLVLWAGAGLAQESPPCDAPKFLDDLPEGTAAERVHRIEAWPGAFGGRVECLRSLAEGRVEQYWAEFLPGGGETEEHVTYTEGRITYFLKFSGDEGAARPVADCARRDGGGFVCRVDMAAGKGLFLVRFFDEALQFTGIRVMAFPASGVVNAALWDMVGDDVEAGRMRMAMDLKLPEAGGSWPLQREAESVPGNPIWGFSGDPAWEVMQAIYTRRQPVVLETRVTNRVNGQEVTTTATQDISDGNLTYLIDKLAKVEELMVSDLEKTKSIKY